MSNGHIAFFGLGIQGWPIAQNLLEAGFPLVAYDMNPDHVRDIAQLGGLVAPSSGEAAKGAGIAIVCVATDDQARQLVLGDSGVLAHLSAGAIIVVHSTISPELVLEIAARSAETGVSVVDAPLSGGAAGAQAKSLLYLVGGEDWAVTAVRSILEVSARRVIHCGGVSAGMRAKLVHQLLMCGNLVIASEAWSLARASGLTPEVTAEFFHEGACQSKAADRFPQARFSDHSKAHYAKDLGLALALGGTAKAHLPVTRFLEEFIDTLPG